MNASEQTCQHPSHAHGDHHHDHHHHHHADHVLPVSELEQPVCVGCQSTISNPLFCFSCNSLQRLNSRPNYFEVFNLPYDFDLNLKELERRYEGLSMELHPDLYQVSNPFEKKQSHESSTLLNKAFVTLRDPQQRANYLLGLLAKGQPLNQRSLPDDFLEDMFELQENLDEYLLEANAEKVAEMKEDLNERLTRLKQVVRGFFAKIRQSGPKQELLQQIQTWLNAQKYLERLLQRINTSDL